MNEVSTDAIGIKPFYYLRQLKRLPASVLINSICIIDESNPSFGNYPFDDLYHKLKELAFKVDDIANDYSNKVDTKYSSEELYTLYNDISLYMEYNDPAVHDYCYYLIENFPKELIRDARINIILSK